MPDRGLALAEHACGLLARVALRGRVLHAALLAGLAALATVLSALALRQGRHDFGDPLLLAGVLGWIALGLAVQWWASGLGRDGRDG